jgi:hypothetical protein
VAFATSAPTRAELGERQISGRQVVSVETTAFWPRASGPDRGALLITRSFSFQSRLGDAAGGEKCTMSPARTSGVLPKSFRGEQLVDAFPGRWLTGFEALVHERVVQHRLFPRANEVLQELAVGNPDDDELPHTLWARSR